MYHIDPIRNERINEEIKRRVEEALRHEKEIALERKNKLRQVLQEEQSQVDNYNESQKAIIEERRCKEMEKRLFDIESKKERQRIEDAKRKLAMQKILNCEEARHILSKQKDDMVKKDQYWQIKEKLAMSSKRAEEDKYYHELMIKNFQESIKMEEAASKSAWKKRIEAKTAYLQQIEWKKQMECRESRDREKEKLELKLAIEKNKEEEEAELRQKMKKSAELAAELKAYMEREQEMRKQREMEEKALQNDIAFIIDDRKGIEKCRVMRELQSYQECLDSIKRKREIEERQFDERLEQLTREMEKRKDDEKRKLAEARQELMGSVYRGREEQIREKAEQEKRIQYENAMERQQVYADVEKHKWDVASERKSEQQRKRAYAEELLRQIREREEARVQAEKEEIREKEAALAEEEQRKQELEFLINHPPDTHQHPLVGVKSATFYIPP